MASPTVGARPFQTDNGGIFTPAHQVGAADSQGPLPFHETPQKTGATGGGSQDPTNLPTDWYKAFFQQYGLPGNVQQDVMNILTKYASDPTTAQALATQYLRQTPWYQTTFPGFNEGVRNGLFTDETGYRSYLNAYNALYNQYLGRHITSDETQALLNEGVSPTTLGNRFQGQAYIAANRPEIQYLAGAFGNGQLNEQQLTALGNEQAGIDTQQGQLQQKILAKAQQIHDKLFQGNPATPSLSIGAAGLYSPSLAGTKQLSSASGSPDVHA